MVLGTGMGWLSSCRVTPLLSGNYICLCVVSLLSNYFYLSISSLRFLHITNFCFFCPLSCTFCHPCRQLPTWHVPGHAVISVRVVEGTERGGTVLFWSRNSRCAVSSWLFQAQQAGLCEVRQLHRDCVCLSV